MHETPRLGRKELREFGLITGTILAIIFGFLLPWIRGHSLPHWPWMIASIFWFLAILTPLSLRPIYHIWTQIGLVLGWINTRFILGIIFYGLFMPMGIIMSLLKRDAMTRKIDINLQTYRIPNQSKDIESMERPF